MEGLIPIGTVYNGIFLNFLPRLHFLIQARVCKAKLITIVHKLKMSLKLKYDNLVFRRFRKAKMTLFHTNTNVCHVLPGCKQVQRPECDEPVVRSAQRLQRPRSPSPPPNHTDEVHASRQRTQLPDPRTADSETSDHHHRGCVRAAALVKHRRRRLRLAR